MCTIFPLIRRAHILCIREPMRVHSHYRSHRSTQRSRKSVLIVRKNVKMRNFDSIFDFGNHFLFNYLWLSPLRRAQFPCCLRSTDDRDIAHAISTTRKRNHLFLLQCFWDFFLRVFFFLFARFSLLFRYVRVLPCLLNAFTFSEHMVDGKLYTKRFTNKGAENNTKTAKKKKKTDKLV